MPSRSEDFERGTVIKCVHDGGFERAFAARAPIERELIAAGYMRLIYAPDFYRSVLEGASVAAPAQEVFRFYFGSSTKPYWISFPPGAPLPDICGFQNAWAQRWLVYTHREFSRHGMVHVVPDALRFPLNKTPPVLEGARNAASAISLLLVGKRETYEDRLSLIKWYAEEQGCYREDTD